MPTGYTAKIYDGQEVSGKEFIMDCARAFGACIMMRDEPSDAEIPEGFQPSTYHKEAIETAKEKLKKYQNMSVEEARVCVEKAYANALKEKEERLLELINMKNRYMNTLTNVSAWQPPTSEHVNLKEFAMKQLEESIEWDCDLSYYMKEVTKQTPAEYIQFHINTCLRDIDYHERENDLEIKRTNERNKWIKDLRDSL